eukprot:s3551_g2.t1
MASNAGAAINLYCSHKLWVTPVPLGSSSDHKLTLSSSSWPGSAGAEVLRAAAGEAGVTFALSKRKSLRFARIGRVPVPWHAMHAWRRSVSPVAPTPEALFGPVDLPGDTAVMLIAFGSIGRVAIGISPEVFPTLDAASKTPPGPVRSFGGGPVGVAEITDPAGFAGDGEVTDPAGFAGGGEFTDPAGFAGGVLGAATLGDPTELFPVVPFGAPAGGVFTHGLFTGAPPVGIGFSLGGGVDGGGNGAGIGGGGGGMDCCGGLQPGGGWLGGRGSLGGRPLGPMATAAPDFPSLVSPVVMGVSQE